MNDNIISINALTKKYGNIIALNNVSLDFPKGKIIGLLGPNGSGKTTMIKVLTCLLNKYDGNVLIDGKKLGIETKKIVSYLPDRNILPPRMKVCEIIDYFGDFFDDFDKNLDKVIATTIPANIRISVSSLMFSSSFFVVIIEIAFISDLCFCSSDRSESLCKNRIHGINTIPAIQERTLVNVYTPTY